MKKIYFLFVILILLFCNNCNIDDPNYPSTFDQYQPWWYEGSVTNDNFDNFNPWWLQQP